MQNSKMSCRISVGSQEKIDSAAGRVWDGTWEALGPLIVCWCSKDISDSSIEAEQQFEANGSEEFAKLRTDFF